MSKRGKKGDDLPWYRSPEYKGDLSESEKAELDEFRTNGQHPAARYEELPGEVRIYITKLEGELYDIRQGRLAAWCFLVSALGLAALVAMYLGYYPATPSRYFLGFSGLVLPLVVYFYFFNKNAREYLPHNKPYSPTNEALRAEWEMEHIARRRG